MKGLFVACALIVGSSGCAGTVGGESSFAPGEYPPADASLPPDSGTPPTPGNDSAAPPPGDDSGTTPPGDDSGGNPPPRPDSGGEPVCIKKDDGSCCLENKQCPVPDFKCPAGTVAQKHCSANCTTEITCLGDPDEPECVLKNGLCCLGNDCVITTLNVNCADGYEPGELYCTETCMPMRDCVPSQTGGCVAKGDSCCIDDLCTSVSGLCAQGVQKFLGCSAACVPQFECV